MKKSILVSILILGLGLLSACGGGVGGGATPTVTISVSTDTTMAGQPVTLAWSSTNATSCTASASPSESDWSGSESTSGSKSVTPAAAGTSTYTLTCTGAGGTASASATVTVSESQPVTVTISASGLGRNSVTLTWSSTNATSCTASSSPLQSDWSGSKPTSGSEPVTSPATGESSITYALTCTGPGGSASAYTTVNPPCVVGPCRFGAGLAINTAPSSVKHHHYKLIDMGTFGGPQSYLDRDNGLEIPGSSPLLSDGGTVTGFADTNTPDPFAPDFCFEDCYVTHVFQWRKGVLNDLGALPGGGSSASTWINSNGLIAGLSENGEIDPLFPDLPEVHAVLWRNGEIIDLKTLPEGGFESEANAVNSRGQVVGAALNTVPDANSMAVSTYWLYEVPYGYQTRAFIWEKGTMQDLGTLGTGTDAQAISINEAGQVIGWSYTNSNSSAFCVAGFLTTDSFIWDRDEGMKDLGTLGGTCTLAQDLNDQGQIVGSSNLTGDLKQHAFLWESGSIQDLGGSLGGDYTGAFAVNAAGEAVGYAYRSGDSVYHGTLWKNVGKMIDLGVVGADTCSVAGAINDKTQIVGASAPGCDFDKARAVLWEEGSLVNLNALIPNHPELRVQFAENINDRGEIVATALDVVGNDRAVLLIPCDSNHPDVDGCDYSVVEASAVGEPNAEEDSNSPMPAASDAKVSPFELVIRPPFSAASRKGRFSRTKTSPR